MACHEIPQVSIERLSMYTCGVILHFVLVVKSGNKIMRNKKEQHAQASLFAINRSC